MGKGIQIIFG